MELVEYQGMRMPLIPLPGGCLLLGTGPGGFYLKNRGEEAYLHDGRRLFLNPHFTLDGPSAVSVHRNDDGRASGMCFLAGGGQDFVPREATDSLFEDIARRLEAAFGDDEALRGHVAREIARGDMRRAGEAMYGAAEAFITAGRAFLKARKAAGEDDDESVPDDAPVVFVVAGIPDHEPDFDTGSLTAAAESLAEILRGDPTLGGAPVSLVCGDA